MSNSDSKSEAAQAKRATEQRKKAELREKRTQQLQEARSAIGKLEKDVKTGRTNLRLCNELLDHSEGFYEEVDKLAKGRTAFPATPLVRQSANDIISDAKKLVKVKEDVHMDRIKEFVPAGDEPLYPDVLVTIRSVRNCLERHREKQTARVKGLDEKLRVVETVAGALEYFLNDEEASDEDKELPSKESVQAYTNGQINGDCFTQCSDDYTSHYFDFDKLDSMPFQDYLLEVAGGTDGGEEDPSDEMDPDENGEDGDEE
jgi:hypothetical protein